MRDRKVVKMFEIIPKKKKHFRLCLPDKYDLNQYCRDLKSFWYRIRYGIKIEKCFNNGTLLPSLGRGKFVDVIKKGPFLDITKHYAKDGIPDGTVRLIPCEYNHGVMVEFIAPDGQVHWRTLCDYDAFLKMGFSMQEKSS